MDDGDGTEQSFRLLSKDIANVSLAELVETIHKKIPTGSREVYLGTFIAWLHGRLSVIDNSDETIFNNEVDSWCTFLAEFGFEREAIVQGFDEWKRSQSVADPSSSRRLNFAGMRIVHVLSPSSPEEAASGDTATTQPGRALLAFDDADPDPDDEEPAVQDDGSLSFLTGANAMVHGTSSSDHGSPALPLVQHTASPSASSTRWKTKTKKTKVSSNYICNRCGRGGHHVNECPTNMDPSYDSRPYPVYQCNKCGAKAEHYATLCPQNMDRDSITQQRVRHAQKFGLVAKRHGPGFRAPSPDRRIPVRHILYSPERYGWDDEPPRHREDGGRRSGWRDWSPQPRERYPLRDIRSPRRRTRSPRRDDPDPYYRHRSPRRYDSSPHPWARSPDPYYRHRSPRRHDSSPHPWAQSPGRGERSPYLRGRSPRRDSTSSHPRDHDHDRFTRWRRSVSPLPRANHSRHSSPRPSTRSSRTPAHATSAYGGSRKAQVGMSSNPAKGRDSSMALSDHPSGSFLFHDSGAEPKSSPEEGETFSDESDNQTGNNDRRRWKQPEAFVEGLDNLISDMSDIRLPESEPLIEFGVTPKSLVREPPYHPTVLELFRNKPNVWMHRVKRRPAWDHWVDTGSVKAPTGSTKTPTEGDVDVAMAPAKPSTGEAFDENMDLDSSPLQDDPSTMQQEETGGTENQPQISNTSEGPEDDEDVVMEDTGSTEEPTCVLPGQIGGLENTRSDNETTWTGLWGKSQASKEGTGNPETQHSSPEKASANKRLHEIEEEIVRMRAKITQAQAQDGGTDQ